MLIPDDCVYYIAFDIVFDNQDIVKKYQRMRAASERHPDKIIILDLLCFEYVILRFSKLLEWSGTSKHNIAEIRSDVLRAVENHRIQYEMIQNEQTWSYIRRYKKFSAERLIKSLVRELTENDMWSVSGNKMGACWTEDCCAQIGNQKVRCNVGNTTKGVQKLMTLRTYECNVVS